MGKRRRLDPLLVPARGVPARTAPAPRRVRQQRIGAEPRSSLARLSRPVRRRRSVSDATEPQRHGRSVAVLLAHALELADREISDREKDAGWWPGAPRPIDRAATVRWTAVPGQPLRSRVNWPVAASHIGAAAVASAALFAPQTETCHAGGALPSPSLRAPFSCTSTGDHRPRAACLGDRRCCSRFRPLSRKGRNPKRVAVRLVHHERPLFFSLRKSRVHRFWASSQHRRRAILLPVGP